MNTEWCSDTIESDLFSGNQLMTLDEVDEEFQFPIEDIEEGDLENYDDLDGSLESFKKQTKENHDQDSEVESSEEIQFHMEDLQEESYIQRFIKNEKKMPTFDDYKNSEEGKSKGLVEGQDLEIEKEKAKLKEDLLTGKLTKISYRNQVKKLKRQIRNRYSSARSRKKMNNWITELQGEVTSLYLNNHTFTDPFIENYFNEYSIAPDFTNYVDYDSLPKVITKGLSPEDKKRKRPIKNQMSAALHRA